MGSSTTCWPKGRTVATPRIKMRGHFQQKPGAREDRVEIQGSQQEMAKSLSHLQVKEQGPRLESMQGPGSFPVAPQPLLEITHTIPASTQSYQLQGHPCSTDSLMLPTPSAAPTVLHEALCPGHPSQWSPSVHKNMPTISTTFPTHHAQNLEGLSFHFWDLGSDRRQGFF